MRLLIAGSRSFKDYDILKTNVDSFIKEIETNRGTKITEIVSGNAEGADKLGERYAKEHGYGIKLFPADWKDMSEPCIKKLNKYGEYNALSGHKRNKKMAEYTDFAIIFSFGTRGSKNMVEQMIAAGKEDDCKLILLF